MTAMNRENLEEFFRKHGYTDFKWIDPKEFNVPANEQNLAVPKRVSKQ